MMHGISHGRRRALVGGAAACACVAGAALGMGRIGTALAASGEAAKPSMSPDEALRLLKEGNTNFVDEAPYRAVQDHARRLEIARSQHPFCILVGCSDSRVPPELLFGRGLGELFIIRVAGNTVDQAGLGSIEYGVAALGVPLIVVLGHERCGAVQAAVDVVEKNATFPGAIGDLVGPIVPSVLKARGQPGDLLDNAVRENVRHWTGRLRESGPVLSKAVEARTLRVVGARYDLDDGLVDFFDEA